MTKFSEMRLNEHGKLIETDVREIPQSAIQACPHCIMVADHYRPDGSCKCDDPNAHEMAGWGYAWNGKEWVA